MLLLLLSLTLLLFLFLLLVIEAPRELLLLLNLPQSMHCGICVCLIAICLRSKGLLFTPSSPHPDPFNLLSGNLMRHVLFSLSFEMKPQQRIYIFCFFFFYLNIYFGAFFLAPLGFLFGLFILDHPLK